MGGDDPQPLVHQVHEIPVVRPHVTAYHQHRLTCTQCGTTTAPPLPDDAVYGPRGACGCVKTAVTCRELTAVETCLWTFTRVTGVEPTNNAAERALRHAVCGRKTRHGTASEKGSRFVERILTEVASCRQQERNVPAFLTDAIQAARTGAQPPSLIPQGV
ncbi:Mobile element protein [Fimbriiglobus ruber]|uniref:Mobile element protein n=1 Tax=Fimbriiglobus ruber TaxID=1908690 RepID=A0A225D1P5_9BACT|nr:Mobile element protein [Fimbriiglobus ruber]